MIRQRNDSYNKKKPISLIVIKTICLYVSLQHPSQGILRILSNI